MCNSLFSLSMAQIQLRNQVDAFRRVKVKQFDCEVKTIYIWKLHKLHSFNPWNSGSISTREAAEAAMRLRLSASVHPVRPCPSYALRSLGIFRFNIFALSNCSILYLPSYSYLPKHAKVIFCYYLLLTIMNIQSLSIWGYP